MKLKLVLALLASTLWCIPAFAQSEGTPVRNIIGSGPPGGSVAHTVGTEYIDQSVSPNVLYVCSSVQVAAGPNPPAGTQTCTWTQAGSSSGSAANQPNVINPALAPYNAPLTQTCTFSALTVTNTSNVVSCSTATFTSADIGKVAWASCCGGIGGQNKASSVLILAQGVIHDIISATSVHICTTTGTCTPVNATANATAGALFYWGFKADTAVAAAIAATYAGPGPCNTFFWSGWLMVSKGVGNGPANCIVPIGAVGDTNLSILGTGRANSVLLMSPDFDFTTGLGNSCGGGPANKVCFFGLQGIERKYFGINGGGRSNTGSNFVVILDALVDDYDFDVGLSDIGAQDANMICYEMDGSGAYPNFVEVDGCGEIPIKIASGTANTLVGGYAADVLGNAGLGGCMEVAAGATVNTSLMYFGPANSGGAASCIRVESTGVWNSTNDICISGTGTNCITNLGTIHLTSFSNPTDFTLTAARALNNAGGTTYVVNSNLFGTTNPVLSSSGTVFIDDKTTFGGGGTNSGLAPTCPTVTGATATCAAVAGSTNEKGTLRITVTAAGTASGTVTMNFSGTFAGGSATTPACTFVPANTGAGAWNARATMILSTRSTTAPIFNWDNNAAALTNTTWDVDYICAAR